MRFVRAVAILFAVLFVFSPFLFAYVGGLEGPTELIEKYEESNDGQRGIYGQYPRGQTFTIGNTGANKNYVLWKVQPYIRRVGSPGVFYVCLWAVDGSGLPTGSNLSVGSYNGNSLPDGTWAYTNITMTPYVMQKGTQYAFFIYAPNGDSSNNINYPEDTTGPTYTGGCLVLSNDRMATWSKVTTEDFWFKVWGNESITIVLGSEYPADGAVEVPMDPYLNITVNDTMGGTMDILKRTNATGGWQTLFWLNNTGNVTMSNATSGVFVGYGTKYWWSVNVTNGAVWANKTYSFTATAINTSVDAIVPYERGVSFVVNATGAADLSNVTLYYRYSVDNVTWETTYDGDDYNISMSLVDALDETTYPALVDYVNELDLNDDETVLYCAGWNDGVFFTVDVTKPWDMSILDSFTNSSTARAHSVDYFNYTAVGLPYGEVVFITQYNVAKTLVSFNVTNPADIKYMDTVTNDSIAQGMYADVVYHDTTGDVIVAVGGYTRIALINATNPSNMKAIGYLNPGATHEFWFPWFDKNNNDYLYCAKNNGFGTNYSIPIINVSNPAAPVVAEWVTPVGLPTRWSQIGDFAYGGDWTNENIHVYNVSDPENWALVDYEDVDFGAVHDSYRHPFYGDFVIGHAKENDRMRSIYIKGGTPVFAGDVESLVYTNTHSVVIKGDGSCIFGSTYSQEPDMIHATNLSLDGQNPLGAWIPFETDFVSPWSWTFTFPDGPGYYEFFSLGKKTGEVDELPPDEADAICRYSPANQAPLNQNPSPPAGAVNVYPVPKLEISVGDSEGDTMNVTFLTNATGVWGVIGTNSSVGNGTYRWTNGSMSSFNTRYWWNVSTDDGMGNWDNDTFYFTTRLGNIAPVIEGIVPGNRSTGVSTGITNITINISDAEGNAMNWSVETSPDIGSDSGTGVSNGTQNCSVSGLLYSTNYTVYVNITDGDLWTNGTFWFVTGSKPNSAPVVSNELPGNGSTGVSVATAQLSFRINDSNGDTMNYTVETKPNIGSDAQNGKANGTYTVLVVGLAYSTLYYWYVNVTDGEMWTNETFYFTTASNSPPFYGVPSPINGSTGRPSSFTWQIAIADPEGDLFNWSINCSNGQHNEANGASNGTKSLALSGLSYSTTYRVWVNATDTESGNWTREWFTFTTVGAPPVNNPPVQSLESPANNSVGVSSVLAQVSVYIGDVDVDFMSWSIEVSNGDSSSGSGVLDGVVSCVLSGLGYNTTYTWYVNVTDGTDWSREWYNFTTRSEPSISVSLGISEKCLDNICLNLTVFNNGTVNETVWVLCWLSARAGAYYTDDSTVDYLMQNVSVNASSSEAMRICFSATRQKMYWFYVNASADGALVTGNKSVYAVLCGAAISGETQVGLFVVVVDESANPLEAAGVRVVTEIGMTRTGTTNAQGAVSFVLGKPETVTITAEKDGYETQQRTERITRDTTITFAMMKSEYQLSFLMVAIISASCIGLGFIIIGITVMKYRPRKTKRL